MLAIYSRLFGEFARADIDYSVFKGLDHLSEDLDDARGDVDIWVARPSMDAAIAIAADAGFFRVRWSYPRSLAFVMIGWDIATGLRVMIHVHRAPIALRKRSLALLVFSYQISPVEKQRASLPVLVGDAWFRKFETGRTVLNSSSTGALLRLILVGRRQLAALGFRFSPRETLRTYVSYVHRFVFLGGKFRIVRRGLFIAFTGVDGSGKSSVVTHFAQSDFLKVTEGTRIIYMGNHAFWIPGLDRAVDRGRKGPSRVVVMALATIDRKLRIVPALLARARGRIVLFDRYFYDQNIADPTQNYFKNPVVRAMANPFVKWIPATPDLSFYLALEPKVAHARKPEGEIETLEAMSDAYNAYFRARKEVTVIDAGQELGTVLANIRLLVSARLRPASGRNGVAK